MSLGKSMVKRFLIYALLWLVFMAALFFGGIDICEAVTWHKLGEADVQWDVVVTLDNGDPIPAGVTVKYRVYLAPEGDKPNLSLLGETDQLEFTIGVPGEGLWIAGVSAVRYEMVDGVLTEINESEINWSDEDGEWTPEPFGFDFHFELRSPKNLHKVEGGGS